MKKRVHLTLLYCIVLLLSNSAFAVNSKPIPSGKQPTIEIIQKQLSVDDLLQKDRLEIEAQLGIKLSLKERLALKLIQKRVKKAHKKGASKQSIQEAVENGEFKQNVGALLLSFALSILGVLIVYLFFKKDKKNARLSAWIGFGTMMILVPLLVIVLTYITNALGH